jgi:FMN phosphatase YigB (HAD superfamily)
MKGMRKTLVLFDVGAVLVKLDYKSFYEKAAQIRGCTTDEFGKVYSESNIELDALLGKISAEENLSGVANLISPNTPIPKEQIMGLIKLNWPGEIREMIDLKSRAYRAGYSVGLLSNMSAFALDTINGQWPDVLDLYDNSMPAIYSFQVGSVKPQPEIYQQIKGYNRVIFIDDKESYLRTGIEQFGWLGIHFTPYIDPSEAIRAQHSDSTKPKHNFYATASAKDLENCLKSLGVRI